MLLIWIYFFSFSIFWTEAMPQISYPEHFAMNKSKSNAEGRIPVYSPANCKDHELLYPGDQADDWICDCEPGAVYYPESDACFPVYRQGPCAKNKMLVLGLNQIIPECIDNECHVDGKVRIKNVCYDLGSKGPCPMPELSYVIGANINTLKLDCIKLSIDFPTRFGEQPQETSTTARSLLGKVDLCARGSKRAIQGHCPEVK